MSENSKVNPKGCKYLLDIVCRISGAVESDRTVCTAYECTYGAFKGQNAQGNVGDTRSAVLDLPALPSLDTPAGN